MWADRGINYTRRIGGVTMKYVILGGVAAGTKAAAKLKRLDRQSEVKIFTKSTDISYAG